MRARLSDAGFTWLGEPQPVSWTRCGLNVRAPFASHPASVKGSA